MIENFVIKERVMLPMSGRQLDRERIVNLPDDEFSELYLELMTEYKDKDGWWTGDKIPKCGPCHEIIDVPANLRRHYARTLDHGCFQEVYAKERPQERNEIRGKYFDKVANLGLISFINKKTRNKNIHIFSSALVINGAIASASSLTIRPSFANLYSPEFVSRFSLEICSFGVPSL